MAELSEHPTQDHFQRYRERTLSPRELIELDDHLASCNECRSHLESSDDLASAHRLFNPEQDREHLTYEQLEAYVDGAMPDEEAAAMRRHLFRCAQCSTEAKDLRLIKGELEWTAEAPPVPAQPQRPGWLAGLGRQPGPVFASSRTVSEAPATPERPRSLWLPGLLLPAAGAAAIAVVLLAAQVGTLQSKLRQEQASVRDLRGTEQRLAELEAERRALETEHRRLQAQVPRLRGEAESLRNENEQLSRRLRQAQSSAGTAVIRDGDGTILVDPAGRASRVLRSEPLPQFAMAALESGELQLPDEARELLAPSTITRGGGARFSVSAPVATRVLSATPEFVWNPVPKANRYEVVLTELVEGAAPVEYNAGRATRWIAGAPLVRGRRYAWEVRAYQDEELLGTAPQPPDPAARFEVLPAEEAMRLERELAKHAGSPLSRALLQARAGLIQQAEAELQALVTANPGSDRLAALHAKVRASRKLGSTPGSASGASPHTAP